MATRARTRTSASASAAATRATFAVYGARVAGVILVLLGTAVVVGWWLHIAPLVQVGPHAKGMVFNTALGFVLAGMALAAPRRARRVQSVCAAAVLTLTGLTLIETLSGIDLGIDWHGLQRWFDDGNPIPGRMATSTTITLLAAALALLVAPRVRTAPQAMLVKGLTFAVLGIGSAALLGHALGIRLLYSWYAFSSMAVHTAAALVLLGLGLWASWWTAEWNRAVRGEDARITETGTWVLVLVALTAALPGFVALQSQTTAILEDGLRLALQARVDLIANTIELRTTRAAMAASRPSLIAPLHRLGGDPGDAAARRDAQRALDILTPFGFRAVALELPDGTAVAQIGGFAAPVELSLPIATGHDSTLLWSDGLILRQREPMRDAHELIGAAVFEQDLPRTTATLLGGDKYARSGEMLLCQAQEDAFRCLPTRLAPHPFSLPRQPAGRRLFVHDAVDGQTGVGATRDYRGQDVVGAYGPVGTLGMVAVLEVDAAELYEAVARRLHWTLVALVLLIVAGSLALRSQVGPLAAGLVRAEQEATTKGAALAQSQEFLRGVFESNPDAAVVVGESGRIVRANAEAEALFGYRREELLQRAIDDLLPARFGASDTVGRRADGVEFPVDVKLSPLHLSEGNLVIAIVRDVTERRDKDERIAAALREKDLLLGEVHHRVKNNLQLVQSLLNLQSGLVADAAVLETLRDAQSRIQAMALVHQTLYESKDFARVDFRQFLQTLTGHLFASYGRESIRSVLDATPVLLPMNAAIPCGLIVNELVVNALKHAFPDRRSGEVKVELGYGTDGQIELAVSDDGVGIPDGLDLAHCGSLGMEIVHLLTDQLGGTLTVRRRGPTRLALRFPVAPIASAG